MEKNVYLVPLAIIVAGALIGGGLAFGLSKIGSASLTPGNNQNAPQVDIAAQLPKIAQNLKLDTQKFNTCLTKTTYASKISADAQDALKAGAQGTPYSVVIDAKGKKVPISGAYPYENVKAIIDSALKGFTDNDTKGNGQTKPIELVAVSQQDHITGNANAPVTIIEYSDLECPFCKRFYPTTQQVLKDYQGKVRLVYRHFPLTQIHPYAQVMAEASECAAQQGKFWEYVDALFTLP